MKKKMWIAGTGLLALLISFSQAQVTSTGDQKPPEVIALKMLPKETGQMIQLKKAVEAEIDGYSTRLYEMNDWLYHNPESGFQEVQASKMLGDELKMHGFDVKYGVDGLDEEFNRFVEERYLRCLGHCGNHRINRNNKLRIFNRNGSSSTRSIGFP